DGRAGLLLRAPLLVSKNSDSSIIKRGVATLVHYLCLDIGPPAGISLTDPALASDDARRRYSNRERIANITASDGCMKCHASINPYGFLFEAFDAMGRMRAIERTYSTTSGLVIAEHAVDTSVDGLEVDGPGRSLSGAADLMDELR